jgi:hypothetical protein
MPSMNFFDSDMSIRTNTVVHVDGKDGKPQGCCSVFESAKLEQRITRQHVLLRRETLIDGRAVIIIMCLHRINCT